MLMRVALVFLTNLAIVVVASFVLNLLGVGSYIGAQGLNYSSLMAICLVFGMTASVVSLLMSKWLAKKAMNVYMIDTPRNEQEAFVYQTTQELAQKAGIGMPEVGIFSSPQSNAFATGWNRNNALVAVSSGLLQSMSKEEVKAVIGHEIGHVANGDMVTLALIQGVVNAFVMFFARIVGYAVDQFFRSNNEKESSAPGIGFYIATLVAEIVFGILASIIVCWFSRRREFKADQAGAQLVSTSAMIGALQRLKIEYEQPSQLPSEMVAFGISGENKHSILRFFMTHPPLDDRIAALQRN